MLLNEPAVTVLKRDILILSNIQLIQVLTKFIVLPNKCVILIMGNF